MSNLQIIEELCKINAAQADIITAQAAALEQLGAVCMEEERAECVSGTPMEIHTAFS